MADGKFCAEYLSQNEKSCQRRDCSYLGIVRNWVGHCAKAAVLIIKSTYCFFWTPIVFFYFAVVHQKRLKVHTDPDYTASVSLDQVSACMFVETEGQGTLVLFCFDTPFRNSLKHYSIFMRAKSSRNNQATFYSAISECHRISLITHE